MPRLSSSSSAWRVMRQLVVTVDHGFSLSNPALVSAPLQKIYKDFPFSCKLFLGNGSDCESITGLSRSLLGSGPDGNRALGPHSFFGIKSPPDFLPGSPSAGLTYCPSTRLARSKISVRVRPNSQLYAAAACG